jgi:hypothetical protein
VRHVGLFGIFREDGEELLGLGASLYVPDVWFVVVVDGVGLVRRDVFYGHMTS